MDQLGITVFDVAVIAIAVFGALMGMSSGFAHAVLFIASWIGAGWVSWRYAKLVQPVTAMGRIIGGATMLVGLALFGVLTSVIGRALLQSLFGAPGGGGGSAGAADLRLLGRLASLAETQLPWLQPYRPQQLVKELAKSLQRELDLAHECRQAERIARNLACLPARAIRHPAQLK
mgnify:CR=1 FL=1